MKNVLKIWLVDNTVTVDNKDDKIGQLESSGNLSLQDILDEMHKEDTGLRPETIEHVVKLYNRVVSDLILSGYSVNTGLYHAVAQLRGVIDGENGIPRRTPSTSPSPKTKNCVKLSPKPLSVFWANAKA